MTTIEELQEQVILGYDELIKEMEVKGKYLTSLLQFQPQARIKWGQYSAVIDSLYNLKDIEVKEAEGLAVKALQSNAYKSVGIGEARLYAQADPAYIKAKKELHIIGAVKNYTDAALKAIDALGWRLNNHTDLIIKGYDRHIF